MSVRTSPNSITPTEEARPLKLSSPSQRRRQQKNADRSKKIHYKSSKNASGSHGIHQRHVSCLDNLEKHEIVEACNCSVLEIHQKHLFILGYFTVYPTSGGCHSPSTLMFDYFTVYPSTRRRRISVYATNNRNHQSQRNRDKFPCLKYKLW
jgi:hypothetical protein